MDFHFSNHLSDAIFMVLSVKSVTLRENISDDEGPFMRPGQPGTFLDSYITLAGLFDHSSLPPPRTLSSISGGKLVHRRLGNMIPERSLEISMPMKRETSNAGFLIKNARSNLCDLRFLQSRIFTRG